MTYAIEWAGGRFYLNLFIIFSLSFVTRFTSLGFLIEFDSTEEFNNRNRTIFLNDEETNVQGNVTSPGPRLYKKLIFRFVEHFETKKFLVFYLFFVLFSFFRPSVSGERKQITNASWSKPIKTSRYEPSTRIAGNNWLSMNNIFALL